MKKLLLSSLALALALNASAQAVNNLDSEPETKIDVNRLRFGAYFAPNVSWMKATSAKSDDGNHRVSSNGSKVGYTWGLMIDYFFADNYGIATGFQINTSGGKIKTDRIDKTTYAQTVYKTDFNYSLQYLEIPFQIKLLSYPFPEAGDIRILGQVGVTGGFNIGKKATYSVTFTDEYNAYQTLTGDREKIAGTFSIAPFLLQLNLGAGIEKPIAQKMSLYFGVFFNNAFLPDVTNPKKYQFDYKGDFSDGNIRLNNFAFRFGVFF